MLFARRAVILSFLGAAIAVAAEAAEAWNRYVNSRYGFSIEYPARFRAEPPPVNGDGRAFIAADGASFSVSGALNNPGGKQRTIPEFEAYLRSGARQSDYIRVTYRFVNADMLILSGFRGEKIFYEKYLMSSRDKIINTFVMTYPARLKASYDRVVARMSNSFTAG
jgi:hypothetical protein